MRKLHNCDCDYNTPKFVTTSMRKKIPQNYKHLKCHKSVSHSATMRQTPQVTFRLKHVFYLKDVIFAANDEQRNWKGTDQLSVLLTESGHIANSGHTYHISCLHWTKTCMTFHLQNKSCCPLFEVRLEVFSPLLALVFSHFNL